jgi:hypothetical protein
MDGICACYETKLGERWSRLITLARSILAALFVRTAVVVVVVALAIALALRALLGARDSGTTTRRS